MRQQKGFTLIELLVVIAIIAILAAILFPVFTKARESAMVSQCTSNMHQIGLAVQAYRDVNNGFMPQATNIWEAQYPGNNYCANLAPYAKSKDIFKCKAKAIKQTAADLAPLWYYDPLTKMKPTDWWGVVYTMTKHDHRVGEINPGSLAHLPWSQGKTVINTDNYPYQKNLGCSGPSQAVTLFCMSGTWTINWDNAAVKVRYPDGVAHGSHENGTPCLFADQHVKFIDYHLVGNL